MYCSTNGTTVKVYNDKGGVVCSLSLGGPVESAYMNGEDKVAITYKPSPHSRYIALYDTKGRLLRKTSC